MAIPINSVLFGYLIIFLIQNQIWCQKHKECEGIDQPDTVVASQRSCSKYIFCEGDNSFEGECLAGNYFNEEAGNCDDPENVECNIEEKEDVSSIFDEDSNKSEIERQDNEEDDLITETSDSDSEDIEDLNVNEVEENYSAPISITSKCPELYGFENIKHIVNKESCVAFYTCYNGIAIPMLCPNKMYFHEDTKTCRTEIPLRCKLKYSFTPNCRKGVYDYMPHPKRCEYYHYCLNGFLLIMRCPYDFTWHYERRTCVHKSQSKCYFQDSVIYRYPN